MEDNKIIELYWDKNENAINETNQKYGNYCFTISNNILHSREDSEECVNDTWLHAWNTIPPQIPVNLKMFLVKITRNLSFNRYNAKVAQKRGDGEISLVLDELSECVSSDKNVENEYNAKELNETIRYFIRNLPQRDCNVFIRRYFYAESISDIAQKYKLSSNNVMVILSRTRKKLKAHLIKEGFYNG